MGCSRSQRASHEVTDAQYKDSVSAVVKTSVISQSNIPTQRELINNGESIYLTPEFIKANPDAWTAGANIHAEFYLTDTEFYPDPSYISQLSGCVPNAIVLRCISPSVNFAWYLAICSPISEIPVSAQGASFNISQVYPINKKVSLSKEEYSCEDNSRTFNKDELDVMDCKQIRKNSIEITIPPNQSSVEKEWLVNLDIIKSNWSDVTLEYVDNITDQINLTFVQQAGKRNTVKGN